MADKDKAWALIDPYGAVQGIDGDRQRSNEVICFLERLNEGLTSLVGLAEDAHDFEEIWTKAFSSMVRLQPNGTLNYGLNNPGETHAHQPNIGYVWLARPSNDKFSDRKHKSGDFYVMLTPARRLSLGCTQLDVGMINIRDRTYKLDPRGNKDHDKILRRDLEAVMGMLGLNRVKSEYDTPDARDEVCLCMGAP